MSKPDARPPPPGWIVFNGQLEPDRTVGGYVARRQEVRGWCHMRDCRRRFTVDYEKLLKRGFSAFPMAELKKLLSCGHPIGCLMTFREEREGSGLTMAQLARTPGVRIRFFCEACRWRKEASPAQVLASLRASGRGDGDTLHTELAAKTKPCKCGKTAWRCEVMWPGPANVRPVLELGAFFEADPRR